MPAGRPPKPTALKLLDGSAKHNPGRVNADEPKPDVVDGRIEPPPWLTRRGHAWSAWNRLLPIVSGMKVMTVADVEALALGCMALADYLATDRDDWHKRDAAYKRYLSMLRDFGMTPASRTKVRVEKQPERDPVAAWSAK